MSEGVCGDRYKTRAHKAEARLQEEAGKQKTTPDTGDTAAPAGHVTEEIQTKVRHTLGTI
jgi:hypothetical protein